MSRFDISDDQKMRIAFLLGKGATAEEIEADPRVSLDVKDIRFVIDRANLPPPADKEGKSTIRIDVSRNLVALLDRAANARKVGRGEFAEKILTTVLQENLVGAVVDDGVTA